MPTGSPGDGITPALLSQEPLATEGEATPGPDDVNPYAQMENRNEQQRFQGELDTFDESGATMPDFSGGDLDSFFDGEGTESLPRLW